MKNILPVAYHSPKLTPLLKLTPSQIWNKIKLLYRATFFLLVSLLSSFICHGQPSSVTGFNLINATTNQPIQPLTSGAVVNLATLPTTKLNIQTVVSPSQVGSVVFNLSGQQVKTRSDESGPCYSLQGDSNCDYYNWTPTLGNYTLKAQSFSGAGGTGTAGTALTITFSVVNQPQTLYTLNVTTNGGGTVTKNPNQTSYTSGSQVSITANPDPGFQFTGWSGDATGTTNPLTVTMNSNKNITANFAALPAQYSLNVTTNGNGTVAKDPDQATYTGGSTVMLTATPDSGFVFSGWSGDASGDTNPLTVTMNSNKNITATFTSASLQFNLSVTVNGSGYVVKDPDQPTYANGSIVTLTATPDSGFQFSGWSGDATGTTNPLSVTLNSDKSITANFNLIPIGYCVSGNSDNIGCFTSVRPIGQSQVITYPTATHRIQLLAKSGNARYTTSPFAYLPGTFDFSAYVPKNGSSIQGYLALNHERTPGAVSVFELTLNPTTMLWDKISVKPIDFTPVVRTERNCAGGITAWGTVISAEETLTTGDNNNDGYQDVGWLVEIDPATGLIPDYDGNGSRDKLWALGRMRHENIAIMPDRKTCYFTEDGGTKCIYKFIANQPGNLSEGNLFVMKRDKLNPSTGTWIQVPNTTQSDRNNTSSLASTVGGTRWGSLEELEIGPDGKIYFAETKTGTIWRFTDGVTITGLEPWVTRQMYTITYNGGTQAEDWGTGVDNLAFDGDGNLWVMQDAGKCNLWVVRPDHTAANPKVELFMTTPFDGEPTGLTFSPDFRYGFLSIQSPSSSNTQAITDAAGNQIVFNHNVLLVFANKKYLGPQPQTIAKAASIAPEPTLEMFPNPFTTTTRLKLNLPEKAYVRIDLYDGYNPASQHSTPLYEGLMDAGTTDLEFDPAEKLSSASGLYLVRMQLKNKRTVTKILLQQR